MNQRSSAAAGVASLPPVPGGAQAAANPPPNGSAGRDRAKLAKQAMEFESVYLAEMIKPMFDGTQATEPFGGGFGEDVWRSQQVQEFAHAIARQGGIGLADMVARELIRAQEAGNASSPRSRTTESGAHAARRPAEGGPQ